MQSDMTIPRLSDILDRACDHLGSAYRLQDDASARQLERVIKNLPGARLCWQLGTLIVDSPSGGRYEVSRAGCSCPNAQKGFRQCWHVALFELLLDMLDTEAESADMQADPPDEPNPMGDTEGDELPSYRPLGQRLAVARQCYISL